MNKSEYEQGLEEGYLKIGENGEIVPNYEATLIDFKEGDILSGRVVRIDRDEVLVDVGFKSEGVIPASELSIRSRVNPFEVVCLNEEIEVMVLQKEDQDGRLVLSKKRADAERAFDRLSEIFKNDGDVEGEVIEVVKGGLILDIGVRGFLPASLVDIKRVKNLEKCIGEVFKCKIIELNRYRNNVVLSRKAYLEKSLKMTRRSMIESLSVGQIKRGVISNIVDFGAFVDLGGIDGLIHISELSWNHISHPSEVVKVGDEVDVVVLDIDIERERVSLGLKQTQKDPWIKVAEKFSKGDVVRGKISRIVPFGAFVQIEENIEGLVHVSELAEGKNVRPQDVVKVGQEIDVVIIDVDLDKRRIALSTRKPAEKKEAAESDLSSEPALGGADEGLEELRKEIKEASVGLDLDKRQAKLSKAHKSSEPQE